MNTEVSIMIYSNMKIDKDILRILIEELNYKKAFLASHDTECDICGEDIFDGDDFYFMGNRRKCCENCRKLAIDYLSSLL